MDAENDFIIGYEPAGTGFAVRPVFTDAATVHLQNQARAAYAQFMRDCVKAAKLRAAIGRYLKRGYHCQGDLALMLANHEVVLTNKSNYLRVFVDEAVYGIPRVDSITKREYFQALKVKSPA